MTATKDESGKWAIEGVGPLSYDDLVEMVKKRIPFKFARYGDGEIYCMEGKSGRNTDKHQYFPSLGARLRISIANKPDYFVGIQPLSVSHMPEIVDKYFAGMDLVNADLIHNASIDGRLNEILDALNDRFCILVGPFHLANLFNGIHIVINTVDCWLGYEQTRRDLEFHLEGRDNAVVILCASMMSEVLCSDFADSHHTFIDFGSALDPLVGINSRKYHFNLASKR